MAVFSGNCFNLLFKTFLVVFITTLLIENGGAIKCWQCNSKYDSRCGDPFSNYSVALVDCDQRQGEVSHILPEVNQTELPKASLCRKTTQTVEGELRIIRGCGWVENEGYLKERDCFNRAGTKEVQMYHCVCNTDACNDSSKPALALALIGFVLAVSTICKAF